MKNTSYLLVLSVLLSNFAFSQSIDDCFSQKDMRKDLAIFKEIRLKANSGLYKYRTKAQIDSVYNWAGNEIATSSSYRDFYNIISQLTDFEGSLHNGTRLASKINENLQQEKSGYFPYPIKLIEDKWILNIEDRDIQLGAEIVSINGMTIENIVKNLYKYYTTDGFNVTGKAVGLNYMFSRYYRLHYGRQDLFSVVYKRHKSELSEKIDLQSIGFIDYYKNFLKRYSKPFDEPVYNDFPLNEMYSYENVNSTTAKLTLNSFDIGANAKDPDHLKFISFLDSVFGQVKEQNLQNLIVDIRHNGGGTDPNELVVFEYLTQRKFSENKDAWISFQKIPNMRFIDTKVPSFLRFLGVIKYNKYFRSEFAIEKDGKFYQGSLSEDHQIREPNKNAFKGKIYLLVGPEVASAGSNFGSLLASNINTTVIGEETSGGYYGHNGHTPMSYILPKSKIKTTFSIVNLEQDVIEKNNQIFGRGIIPDFYVGQTDEDYLKHEDTQMKFVLELINKK